jgi:hypothetical protein
MENNKTDTLHRALNEIKRLERLVDEMQDRLNSMSYSLESISDLNQVISRNFESLAEQSIRNLAFSEAVITVLDQNNLISKDILVEAWENAERELLGMGTRILH